MATTVRVAGPTSDSSSSNSSNSEGNEYFQDRLPFGRLAIWDGQVRVELQMSISLGCVHIFSQNTVSVGQE